MTHSDIIIVGSGIVGLAHARAAARRGLSVRILEADSSPRGASIRNFGHCCITGQIGEFSELAEAGREQWLAAAQEANFWAEESGAYVLATSPAQMAVLDQAREAKGHTAIDLLGAEAMRDALTEGQGSRLGGQDSRLGEVIGGAFLRRDLRVDPRTAAPALARSLGAASAVELLTGVRVTHVGHGTVETSVGTYSADHVIVCTGHGLPALFPALAADAGLIECALSMALATTPAPLTTSAALLTRTSLLRYEAFSTLPGAEAVAAEVAADAPALLEVGANVMFGPRPDGSIVIGDSHDYAASADPFLEESTIDVLLAEAGAVLGLSPTESSSTHGFEIRQRWQGIYASSAARPLIVEAVDERTTVATVATGIGMTIAFGLAERTLATLHPTLRAAA